MTIKSMTAFGSGEFETEKFRYTCEMKSLNSRFLEVNPRLPRFLSGMETDIVQLVKKKLTRGKVELYFDLRSVSGAENLPDLNLDAARHYIECSEKMAKEFGFEKRGDSHLNLHQLLKLEGVLDGSNQQSSSEALKVHKVPLLKAINSALDVLISDRSREGETLNSSISEHIQSLRDYLDNVRKRAPEIREVLTDNYHLKLTQCKDSLIEKGIIQDSDLSKERIATELVMMVDKMDVAEEIDRLGAHIDEFEKQMNAGSAIGRKLDFMCQEMHREINTLSNKLVNADIAKQSVEMKQDVERIKQQVQNVE